MRSLASDSSLHRPRQAPREEDDQERDHDQHDRRPQAAAGASSETADVESSLLGRTSTTAPIVTEIGPFFSLKGAATAR